MLIETLRNRTPGGLTTQNDEKMLRMTGNAQSHATLFRHSAVVSLRAVVLHKVCNNFQQEDQVIILIYQ